MDRQAQWIETGLTQEKLYSIEAPSHADAGLALRFWANRPADGIRIGRDVPSRAICRLLSRLTIFQPVADGADFKVHLVGNAVRCRFGRDITGELLSEIYSPEQFELRLACQKAVIATGEPNASRSVHCMGNIEILKTELLRMPAVAPNGVDRWVLAFAFFS